jgi:predicted metalloprotease
VITNSRKLRRARRRNRRLAAVTAVAVVVLVAVGGWGFDLQPASAASGYNADTETSIEDIQSFWSTTMPEVYGRKYVTIPSDRIHPYSASNPPPACGGRGHTPYQEVAGNAFYCDEGDFIAYDAQRLIPQLRAEFGDFAVGLVLAHEWGHAVQTRARVAIRTSVYLELQADCFAGAWAGHVAHGDDTSLRLSEDDLDHALAGFLELRDPSGVDGGDAGAHGNAFDRVGAFQNGFEDGARVCRDYATNPPEVTESGFTSYADAEVNGDLPLDEVLPMLKSSLDDFWAATFSKYDDAPKLQGGNATPTCASGSDGGVLSDSVVYCATTNTINYSTQTLHRAAKSIGDLGAGVFVAAAWSSSVQHQLGVRVGTAKARASAECLTGAWAGGVENGTGARNSRDLSFSPGDLDEVVATFVATDDSSSVDRGSVFTRVALFRAGFERGANACFQG